MLIHCFGYCYPSHTAPFAGFIQSILEVWSTAKSGFVGLNVFIAASFYLVVWLDAYSGSTAITPALCLLASTVTV